jgi:hypothetical protein
MAEAPEVAFVGDATAVLAEFDVAAVLAESGVEDAGETATG